MDVLIISVEMKRSLPGWAHWNGKKRWVMILTFQRMRKHFTELCDRELNQTLSWVVAVACAGARGSEKRIKAERVLEFPERVVFNSSLIDLEFIVWEHEGVRQN